MASFPEYAPSEQEKRANEFEWAKRWIDAIVEFSNGQNNAERIKRIQRCYDTFNGRIDTKLKDFIVNNYGSKLSTTFVPFNLGRTKEKLLFGEMLDIGLSPVVESINPEAINEKMSHIATMTGAIQFKDVLNNVAERTGINVLNGMPIPDAGTPEAEKMLKPGRRNEIAMQRIANKKVADDMLKLKLYETWQSLVITAECHGKIERDSYGNDTFRPIDPKDAIFQESKHDPFCLRTPFDAEKRLLYKSEILSMFPDLKDKDKEIIKKIGTSESDQQGPVDKYENVDGQVAINCYYCNWKTTAPVIIKISTRKKTGDEVRRYLDPIEYEKHKLSFDNGVSKGEYRIEHGYKEELWEGWRIGNRVYAKIGPKPFLIQKLVNGKYKVVSDFVHCLYSTIDGTRMSIEEMIYNLSEMYDLIMHIIKREIKKIKGKVYSYDERFMPSRFKSMKDVMYDVVEHGVIQFNSTIDGMDDEKLTTAAQLIQSIDLGASNSFEVLLKIKQDIKQTIDELTGINESREGFSAASQTATGTMQNIQASRSITKDLFFMHLVFGSMMLTKLCEKVKQNWEYLDSQNGFFLNDSDIKFLKVTEDILMDEFSAYFTDGKKYNEIKEFAMALFPQEINAQMLRTMDAIRFKASESLAEGLDILEKAHAEISKAAHDQQMEIEKMKAEQQQQAMAAQQQQQQGIADQQMQQEQMKLDSKAGIEAMKVGAKGMMNTENNRAKSVDKNEQPTPLPNQ